MRVIIRELEQYAERCALLARDCHSGKAANFLRLLAVDLALDAEQRRARMAGRSEDSAADRDTVSAA